MVVGEGVSFLDNYCCLAQMIFSLVDIITLQAECSKLVVSKCIKQLLILLALLFQLIVCRSLPVLAEEIQ